MKISGQSLIDAMRSFGCFHDALIIYPPGKPAPCPEGFFESYWEYDVGEWKAHCPICNQAWGRNDHDVVQRAVILEALKELNDG